MKIGNWKLKIILTGVTIFSVFFIRLTYAQNVDELRAQINNHSAEIKKLDEEIKKWEQEVNAKAAEAKTLQSTIGVLDANVKKIGAEIKKTEVGINKVNLSIADLLKQITLIESRIDLNSRAIAESLNNLNQVDDISMVEVFLGSDSMAEMFDQYETTRKFNQSIEKKSAQLSNYKLSLQDKKTEVEGEKHSLLGLKTRLSDQKTVLGINKKEKNILLAETKNKESEYKKILAQKQLGKEKFERELFEFESKLKIAIDPSSFAGAKRGVLSWPLDNILITQLFGKTVDSQRLYVSGTHNGVDFRATRGTPVKAALFGTVEAVGNTDAQKGCYSYGKWALVKHENGLSSLYAHLDLIKVASGQAVTTGEIIGYSGQTGYATGPHLHFTLYASQGVSVQRYSQSKNCKNVDIPIAPSNAYLDPVVYFPQL